MQSLKIMPPNQEADAVREALAKVELFGKVLRQITCPETRSRIAQRAEQLINQLHRELPE
ncbi:hypothetical protein [Dongia deserti]|uniref:hypothetical protein n=1 Tax=Dongia deserti TaxID=2268030 RepID=UPI000E64AEA4|nr:hypothetical protein [Dongia deserti]